MRTRDRLLLLMLGTVWLGLPGCTPTPTPSDEGPRYDGGPVSWHRDVQPILQERCQGCHTQNGVAPFALETYGEASGMHAALANSIQARRMPPWMPAEGPHRFRDSRRLTQGELDILSAWSEQGAPEGDPNDAPAPHEPAPPLEWTDLTIGPDEPYLPKDEAADDYHCFLLDPHLEQKQELIGFEVMPGVKQQVHHVLLFAAPRQKALDRDAREAGPGWTCFGDSGIAGASLLGAWAPGSPPTRYPEGTGVRVAADAVFVMQVHYNISQRQLGAHQDVAPGRVGAMHGEAQPDLTRMALQFARKPVSKLASLYALVDGEFAIPPGATGYSHHSEQYVPAGTLWGVLPHMHTKGRRIQVELGGQRLIEIPAWDFHWQQMYFYKQPVSVPLFSQMKLTCAWDNPTPRTVTWGEGTDDEMCLAYLYMTE
ncbi:monooxygenase [Archangium lansingense]|uniref:Copper type II ascorbate-dependent monooxygenase-like protein n=1 Tax=Archangium lansingense TaxID=2995310 RepID=A0ABT4A541_9BACT|nr:hypothetical protein [Archangium lansinium]MCY1076119.1 hypothetical protein [Archangium lansinium]